jgi:hypothetical protein
MPPVVFLTTAFFFLLPLAPAAALLALAAASFPAAPPALALRPAPRYAQISRVPVASLISLDMRPSPQLPPLTHTAHPFRCALPASQRPTHHPTTLAGCVQHRGAAAGWWTSRGRTPAPRPVPRPRPRPPFAPRPALVDAFFLFWRMSSSRGLSMSMPDIT